MEDVILHRKWWAELLKRARNKTQLHSNISPTSGDFIKKSAGKKGLFYVYIVRQHFTKIELYIYIKGPTGPPESERIYNELYSNKTAIESSYGRVLTWEKQPKTFRISEKFYHGGCKDEEDKWPEIQDEMIDNMISLSNALTPFISKL